MKPIKLTFDVPDVRDLDEQLREKDRIIESLKQM